MADGGDFVVVARRKNVRRSNPRVNSRPKDIKIPDDYFDADKTSLRLEEAKDHLVGSDYVQKLFEAIDKAADIVGWRNTRDIEDVVCYGLGNISAHRRVRYQLAVLLILRDRFECTIRVYDPLFTRGEIEFLESLGVDVLKDNEEGKRRIDRPALVYFPHCVRQLTNNFLYANWRPALKNCVLFSNGFSKVLDHPEQAVLNNTAEYIIRINPYTEEFELPSCSEYLHAFYDSAIHAFSPDKLKSVPQGFWEDRKEPEYLDWDSELIVNPRRDNMNPNLKVLRSLISEIRHIAKEKNMGDNLMVRYILEESRKHRETSEVLCKAREELKFLGETYLNYLGSQRKYNEIRKHYAGRGERTVKETADLVGFKLPHDPK